MGDLLLELRVLGQLEGALPPRLDIVFAPEVSDEVV
jgi:hypothetical protein